MEDLGTHSSDSPPPPLVRSSFLVRRQSRSSAGDLEGSHDVLIATNAVSDGGGGGGGVNHGDSRFRHVGSAVDGATISAVARDNNSPTTRGRDVGKRFPHERSASHFSFQDELDVWGSRERKAELDTVGVRFATVDIETEAEPEVEEDVEGKTCCSFSPLQTPPVLRKMPVNINGHLARATSGPRWTSRSRTQTKRGQASEETALGQERLRRERLEGLPRRGDCSGGGDSQQRQATVKTQAEPRSTLAKPLPSKSPRRSPSARGGVVLDRVPQEKSHQPSGKGLANLSYPSTLRQQPPTWRDEIVRERPAESLQDDLSRSPRQCGKPLAEVQLRIHLWDALEQLRLTRVQEERIRLQDARMNGVTFQPHISERSTSIVRKLRHTGQPSDVFDRLHGGGGGGGGACSGGGGGGGGGGDATSSGSSSRQETERERKQELDCMDVHERDHRNEAFQLLSRIFDVVDRDGSRVINETELVESLSDPTTGDVVQNEILSGLMKMATSKDGKISKKNFVNMFTHGFPTYNRVEFEAAVAMLRRLLAHLRAARKASQVEADKRRHKGAPYQERRLVRTPRSQTPRRAKEGPETTSSRPSSASEAKTPYGEKQRTPTAVAVREADGTSRVQRQQAEAPRSTNRPRSQPSTGETARTIARSRPRRGRSPKSEKTKEEEAEEVKESEEPIQPLAFDDPWAAAAARLENGQARPLAFQCASATFEADWAMNQPLSPSGPQSGLRGNHNLIPEEDPEIDLFANVPISADGQKVEFTPTTVVAARSSYKDVFDRVARCEPLSEVASKGLARSPRTAAGGLTPRTIAGNCRTAFLQVVESPEVSRSTPEGIYIHKWRHDRLLFE